MRFFSFSTNRSLTVHSLVMGAGGLIGGFFGYAFHIVTSRFLSIASYGDLQAILALLSIFLVPTQAVLLYVTRKITQYDAPELLPRLMERMKYYLYVSVLGTSGLYALSIPFLLWFLHLTDPFVLLVLIGVSALGMVGALYQGVHLAARRFSIVSMSGILNAALKFFFAGVCVYFFGSVFSIVAGLFIAGSITLVYLHQWIPRMPALVSFWQFLSVTPKRLFQRMYVEGGNILLFSSLLATLSAFDILLAKHILNPEDAGVFAAYSVVGKIIFWIASAVALALFPSVSEQRVEGFVSIQPKVLKFYYFLIGGFGAFGTLIMFLFARHIITALFGGGYISAHAYFWLFGIEASILSFLMVEAYVAYARHYTYINWVLGGTLATGVVVGVWGPVTGIVSLVFSLLTTLLCGYVTCIGFRLWKSFHYVS